MQTVALNLEVSRELDTRRRVLAEAVTARQYELRPDLAERYGEPEIPGLLRADEPLFELPRATWTRCCGASATSRAVSSSSPWRTAFPCGNLYLHVFQRSQHEVGRLWQTNRLSVAQEHYCTAATQLIMSQLYPYVFDGAAGSKQGSSMVATCIGGDLHEIGMRMVSDFFQMEGWDTFYLGANVPAPSLLKTLAERQADLLAVSATMTAHVRPVAELIAAVRSQFGDRIKVLVDGYSFNVDPDLWRRVGADGSARDAREAVDLAERLVGGRDAADAAGAAPAPGAQKAWDDLGAAVAPRESDLYDDLSRLNNAFKDDVARMAEGQRIRQTVPPEEE